MNWNDIIGLGVAGNFTGHLEQAGEASDFVHVRTAQVDAPKGVFPFFVPQPKGGVPSEHFLHQMPISADSLCLNNLEENHQIEPEMALLCDLSYAGSTVRAVTPRWAMAHNDCSIRREGARKISEKKNWGSASKGTSTQRIAIDRFAPGGVLDRYRLACYLQRGERLHAYGVDSPVSGYSYFYDQLLDWLMDCLNSQRDEGPLEDLARWLKVAGYPPQALISVGATRYTAFGETNYLKPGDRSIVVLYDADVYDVSVVEQHLLGQGPTEADGLCVLNQLVG